MSKHVVAAVRDIPPGSKKRVVVKGRPIAIFNLDGEYFGLLDRCPHQGGSLCEGRMIGLVQSSQPGSYEYTRRNEIVRCPWHGWEFDVRTGLSYCDPAKVRAKSYEVGVQPGDALPEEQLVAETVPVSVEEQYVVVEM